MLRARRLDAPAELQALAPQLALLADAGGDPFLSPLWLEAWYAHLTLDDQPLVVAVERADGSLAGLAPLLLTRTTRRKLPVRILRSALRLSAGPCRSGVLAAAGEAAAVIDALCDFLARDFRAWDWIEFSGIAAGSDAAAAFAGAATARGWSLLPPATVETARVLSVDCEWDEFMARRGRHFRRHMADERRRLDRCRWSLEMPRSPAEIAAAMPLLETIVCRRYGLDGAASLPEDDRRAWLFMHDIVDRFAAVGRIDLRLLRIDDQPAAFVLSLRAGDRAYPYLTKYDPAFAAASPGRAVINALIADARNSGYGAIDFLSNWDYLSRFTDDTRDYVRLTAYHSGWYSRLLGAERRLSDRRAEAPAAADR